MSNQPVIVAAKRTPVGRFFGSLAKVPTPQIGAFAIEAVLNDAPAAKDHVDECIMGCVLQAGLGQNPARQAGLKAGLPSTLSAKTINKVCGSGLEAVMLAAQSIKAGDNDCVVAGGMENMTGSPHFTHVRQGVKYGPGTLEDHMAYDGLRCAFECWPMGNAAEHIADKYGITREDQDRFGAQSHIRAAAAWDAGHFDAEVVTLTGEQVGNRKVPGPEGGISRDEGIRAESTADGLGKLRPAFSKDGSITAGNASQISDGGAATIVMSEAKASELGLAPLCKIVSYSTSGVDPKDIFAAPIEGVKGALAKAGWSIDDVDLYELNEAFAAQALCNAKELGIDEAKMNICGGGVAIGHPIGASGARILVTLIHQLKRTGGKKGVAALCLGGGNAVAMCVEMC
ncbi:MAG: acetyl-CoA C-acyltransferase [Phycisphaerae bacterium]|nr:acetyl-CoA C-acyltransferase [Phycisphaerae bacterium]MBM90393.1 acetyl-CoA C-acyltransferase [Phycisphaerae bacterium]HCT44746.1 acetyl-CoA C-acyltransferase [Phycisphaerales bacterium]